MNIIIVNDGSFFVKNNVNMETVYLILTDTYCATWNVRSNEKDKMVEFLSQNYIMMHQDNPGVLIIKNDSTTIQIPTKIFREELEKMISRRIIKEHLL